MTAERRLLARLAWAVVALLTVGIFVLSLPDYATQMRTICAAPPCANGQLSAAQAQALAGLGFSLDTYAAIFVALNITFSAFWFLVAALLIWRGSADRMTLFTAFTLVTFGVARFPDAPVALAAMHPTWWLPVMGLRYLGSACLSFFCYLFPNGRFVPWWTRWIAFAWVLLQIPEFFFRLAAESYRITSTAPGRWFPRFCAIRCGGPDLSLSPRLQPGAAPADQVGGLRRGHRAHWLPGADVSDTADRSLDPAALIQRSLVPGGQLWRHVARRLSLAIAILRHQLYDIDLLINRTLVYGSLTGILFAIYFVSVISVQALIEGVTGIRQESALAIVASTLLTVALIQPLRRRIQRGIDRRFYRRRYDAARTLERLASTLRQEVDLQALSDQLLHVVRDTMQPTHLSLWLRPTERRKSERPL